VGDDTETTRAGPGAGRRAWFILGMGAGSAAAAVALAVIVLLVAAHGRDKAEDPLNAPQLLRLRAELAARPTNRQLAKEIRRLDLQLRREHFEHVVFARRGNWFLLGAVAVFLAGVRSALACARKLARPRGRGPSVEQEMRLLKFGWWAVAGLAALLVVASLAPVAVQAYVAITTPKPLPPHVADPNQVARYWTQFRGRGTQGRSHYDNVPVEWAGPVEADPDAGVDAAPGRNILWRSPVPLPGYGSAVVWNDRVFVTGATRERREVYCFDANSGAMLWSSPVEKIEGSPARTKEAYDGTGYAAPSPVCDDLHVLAVFSNGDLACFDHAGKLLWGKNLGTPNNKYSHASSPVMWRNIVIVQLDQGEPQEMLSKLLAFDAASGRMVWQKRRQVAASWSTPAVINDGRREQILTSAKPGVIAYDPATGAELWRANCLDGDVASTVAYADGIAYAVNTGSKLSAIRTDGSGDVTATHVLWSAEKGLPDTTSPLTDGKLLWTQAKRDLTCFDARTGQVVYEQRLKGSFNASPGLAGGRVYLTGTKGETYVFEAGREYKLLATNRLGEKCSACPAFQDGRIYLRGDKHLFCIGK